jgi:hypothetical protein
LPSSSVLSTHAWFSNLTMKAVLILSRPAAAAVPTDIPALRKKLSFDHLDMP